MTTKKKPAVKKSKKTIKAIGRPSKYSDALTEVICGRIANGESLVRICLDPLMPSRSSVILWLTQYEGFSVRYARAREAQADYLLEELVQIADDGSNDTYISEDGKELTNQDVIARSRLRVDARKWVIAKLAPKKYGEKISQEITGKDGKDLPSNQQILNIPANATPAQIEALARGLGAFGDTEYDVQ